ncbi:MAG: hypothetical protein RLY14_2286 [Planctomycetota bacterium]|jgi:hypothetical protein
MIPELQVYYDFTKKPLPEVLAWLEEMGIPATHRSAEEAPQEWLQRYGCCFPWVVIEGRIQLKAGFKKSQLERLLRRWKGAPKLGITTASESPRAASGSFYSQIGSAAVQELLRALAAYYCHCLDDLAVSKTLLLDSGTMATVSLPEDSKSHSQFPGIAQALPSWEVDLTPYRGKDRFYGNYFLNSFRGGHAPIILAFPDCEGLAPAIVEEALVQLGKVDVVVGATTSCDCYLLGLRSWHEGLFFPDSDEALPESSAKIKARTQSLGLSIYELPTLQSIRSRDDIERVVQGIREQRLHEEGRSEKASQQLLDVCERILKGTQVAGESAGARRQDL